MESTAHHSGTGAKILQKFLDRLACSMDPIPVSTRLCGKEVITPETWEQARGQGSSYERNLKLLEAVMRGVRADEKYFDKFCSVLEEEEVTTGIAREIRGTS